MRLSKTDLLASVIIFIISVFFVFDLFLTPARLSSFDIPFHITNLAQFYLALKDGDFPVVWNDGIANYGLPMSIVAHQLTSYLGAIIIYITQSPLIALKTVAFLGIFLSSLFYYIFVRLYFKPIWSFAAVFLYTFTSYKIINFYIRGAIPEIFAAIFLPLILIGMYLYIKKRNIGGLVLTSVSFFLLALNHPMMLLIYSFIFLPYLVFLAFFDKESDFVKLTFFKKMTNLGILFFATVIGIGMASYYLIPLNLEIKYFYYGQIKNHLTSNSYLFSADFFRFDWKYFTDTEVITRGHIIFPGIIEIFSIVIGILLVNYKWIKEKHRNIGFLEFAVLVSLVILLFTTSVTNIFYEKINILSNIQFPWRLLSAFIFFPPIVYAFFLSKINKNLLVLVFIIIIAVLQFPQLYGKNYTFYPKDFYYFSQFNPHSVLMNTIWSGKAEDYPIKKKNKPAIIEGKGIIISQNIHNSYRNYVIEAKTPLRLVDYTFYFPGWNVYVDKKSVPIEFQNPNYRGVITYQVPPGRHGVDLKFEDTKVRFFSKLLSLFSIILFVAIVVFRKRISSLIKS